MKINICIPTLYGYRSNSCLPQVVNTLIKQLEGCKQEYTITTMGRKNDLYDQFSNPKVIKKYAGGIEGIHSVNALNAEIKEMDGEDFICIYHDDLFIDYDNWPKMFVNIYSNVALKCGVLGVVSHSQSVMGYIGGNVFQASYANGNFFVKAKYVKCGMDINLAEECGDIDLCNEQMINYRRNYIVALPHRHYMTPYAVTFSYLKDFKDDIRKCRQYLNKKWLAKVPGNDWSKYA